MEKLFLIDFERHHLFRIELKKKGMNVFSRKLLNLSEKVQKNMIYLVKFSGWVDGPGSPGFIFELLK